MLDISRLSARYGVRRMSDADADAIFELCLSNPQFYEYCGRQLSRERVMSDLHITPPGIAPSDKYYVGFYDGADLAAVMDLIDGYPDGEHCYIGFFMMNMRFQGRQIGSAVIREACLYLKEAGYRAVRLAIDKGNPQSTHFWKKNGFQVIREAEQDGGVLLVAEKTL